MERFYAAEEAYAAAGGDGAASFDELAACLDPEVVLYEPPGMPFSGTGVWRGHNGIRRFMALFSQAWTSLDVLEAKPLVDGGTVVVLLRVRFRARATGRDLETRIVQVNTVRANQIVEIRPFYWDPASIAEVCSHD